MNETDHWETQYGPQEGAWLRAEFTHVMAGAMGIHNIRIARMDDVAEMAAYAAMRAAAQAPGQGEAGDWEVTSPHCGVRYIMAATGRAEPGASIED
jgi:hypothetical protein